MNKWFKILEKGMWAGWITILLYATASIYLTHYAKIDKEDLSIRYDLVVEPVIAGLIVYEPYLDFSINPWWWFHGWCAFSAFIMLGLTLTKPYIPELPFVPFNSKCRDINWSFFSMTSFLWWVVIISYCIWYGSTSEEFKFSDKIWSLPVGILFVGYFGWAMWYGTRDEKTT